MALGRVIKIYANGHARVEESLQELHSIANDLLYARKTDLDFVVQLTGLKVEGRPVHHEPAVVEAFTEVLRARGVRALVLRTGIRKSELFLLADLLGRKARDLIQDGGFDAALAEQDHPHFNVLTAVTAFGDGDEEGSVDEEVPAQEAAQRQFEELLGEAGELPPDPTEDEVTLAYTACDKEELGAKSSHLLAVAEETLRAEAERHDLEGSAALIICDMVGRAQGAMEYRQRRETLCNVVRERRLDARAMRIAQLRILNDVENWPEEEPSALVLELGALAADAQLIESAMSRGKLTRSQARTIAEQLAGRPDGLDLLTSVLRASLPEQVRIAIEDVLVEQVRQDKNGFRAWALENPKNFLQKSCFRLLIDKVDFVLGPIVKEYLSLSGSKERERLIELLTEMATEKALRLLVMGLRYSGEVRDPRIILALGRFKHPLAVSVLREVVHRCNTERFDAEEAASAIRALAASGIDDALDFLEEVSTARKFLLPTYRRTLRELAQDALEVA